MNRFLVLSAVLAMARSFNWKFKLPANNFSRLLDIAPDQFGVWQDVNQELLYSRSDHQAVLSMQSGQFMKSVPDHVIEHRVAQTPNPEMGSWGSTEKCNLNTPDTSIWNRNFIFLWYLLKYTIFFTNLASRLLVILMEWKLSIFLSWFWAQEPSMQATWDICSCIVIVIVLYL